MGLGDELADVVKDDEVPGDVLGNLALAIGREVEPDLLLAPAADHEISGGSRGFHSRWSAGRSRRAAAARS